MESTTSSFPAVDRVPRIRRRSLQRGETLAGFLFVSPMLIGVFVLILLPIVATLILSFADWNFIAGLHGLKWIGMDNFSKLLHDQMFIRFKVRVTGTRNASSSGNIIVADRVDILSSRKLRIKDVSTGMYIDGMGRTTDGASAGQWGNSNSTNQQWIEEPDGDYVRFRNVATGLYLDGLGLTTNGSVAGQGSDSTSVNQEWSVLTDGDHVRIQNLGTGLFLDGMGRTASGADLGQWGNSNSSNQQWRFVN